jgi:hypothetical protein
MVRAVRRALVLIAVLAAAGAVGWFAFQAAGGRAGEPTPSPTIRPPTPEPVESLGPPPTQPPWCDDACWDELEPICDREASCYEKAREGFPFDPGAEISEG